MTKAVNLSCGTAANLILLNRNKEQIAHFKIPKFIYFVEEFPMTVTGNLQKFRIYEVAMEKMGL